VLISRENTDQRFMNSLVTGAGGFLGGYIVDRLVNRGDRVRTFSRGSYPFLEKLGVEPVRGDIRDAEAVADACRGVETVFHVAARPGIWGRWSDYYQINTVGTSNVVAGCLRHGVSKLVYTSSPSVTFDGGSQEGVNETVPYPSKWLSNYPRSKAIAEQLVLNANGNDGLVTCALRPHLIWGPGDPHLVPRVVARARSGRLRRVGDGANLIDTIFVENAADAHLQAAEHLHGGSAVAGNAYFISQGEPVNCWDWIDQLLAVAGLPPVRKAISLARAKRLGSLCEFAYWLLRLNSEPPMTRFLACQLAEPHWFDISRARRDFGYEPKISMQEGMDRLRRDWNSRFPR
jgi:2-alkyl-3-oxoalkanoate reductase